MNYDDLEKNRYYGKISKYELESYKEIVKSRLLEAFDYAKRIGNFEFTYEILEITCKEESANFGIDTYTETTALIKYSSTDDNGTVLYEGSIYIEDEDEHREYKELSIFKDSYSLYEYIGAHITEIISDTLHFDIYENFEEVDVEYIQSIVSATFKNVANAASKIKKYGNLDINITVLEAGYKKEHSVGYFEKDGQFRVIPYAVLEYSLFDTNGSIISRKKFKISGDHSVYSGEFNIVSDAPEELIYVIESYIYYSEDAFLI